MFNAIILNNKEIKKDCTVNSILQFNIVMEPWEIKCLIVYSIIQFLNISFTLKYYEYIAKYVYVYTTRTSRI